MNDMNGNPHYQPAENRKGLILDSFSYSGENNVPNTLALAQLEATLALAYEQRTANLIALLSLDRVGGYVANRDAFAEIESRLGIEGATK